MDNYYHSHFSFLLLLTWSQGKLQKIFGTIVFRRCKGASNERIHFCESWITKRREFFIEHLKSQYNSKSRSWKTLGRAQGMSIEMGRTKLDELCLLERWNLQDWKSALSRSNRFQPVVKNPLRSTQKYWRGEIVY